LKSLLVDSLEFLLLLSMHKRTTAFSAS